MHGHILEVASECPLPTMSTHSMHPWRPVSSYGRCRMTKLWNHLSKQALEKKKWCLVRVKRKSQRGVLRGAMRWLFHGRTMSRRCSASERPLKTDSTLLETTLAKAKHCWKILPGDESNKAKGYIWKLVQEKLMMGQISIYLILP